MGCTPEEAESPIPIGPPLPAAYYEGTGDGGPWYADTHLLLEREKRVRCSHQEINPELCGTATMVALGSEPQPCPLGCHNPDLGRVIRAQIYMPPVPNLEEPELYLCSEYYKYQHLNKAGDATSEVCNDPECIVIHP